MRDCAAELRVLLQEEKLAGASLLVLANKQDLPGALPLDDIEKVSPSTAASWQREYEQVPSSVATPSCL